MYNVEPEVVPGPEYLLFSADTLLGLFDAWSMPDGYRPWYDGDHMGIVEV